MRFADETDVNEDTVVKLQTTIEMLTHVAKPYRVLTNMDETNTIMFEGWLQQQQKNVVNLNA